MSPSTPVEKSGRHLRSVILPVELYTKWIGGVDASEMASLGLLLPNQTPSGRKLRPLQLPLAFVLGDDAVLDEHNAVRILRNIVLVRNQNNRIPLGLQAVEQRHNLQARL